MSKDDHSHAETSPADGRSPRFDNPGGMNTGVAIVGFVLSFVAGGLLMWGYDRQSNKDGIVAEAGGGWSDNASPIPIDSKDPMWGTRTAPVTIVLFSDYECPYCSRVEESMEKIKTTYGPDKVRIVWKNAPLPFHKNAKPAAEAAQGVFDLKGADAFWKFHKSAFANQKELTPANFEKWAGESGVDLGKFKAGLASHKWAEKVDKDNAVAKAAGVSGTPASFINGVSVSGAQPFEKFKAVIDQELEKAKAKLASGTAKDKLYVEMSKENKKSAPPEKDDEEEKEDTKTVFKVPVGTSAVKGKADALVTLVVFSEFQCPFCKKVGPTLKQIEETYGDKIRVVWKDEALPMHPRAVPAANMAREAKAQKGDAGFWAAHDALFASAPKLEDADFETIAKNLGLDVAKVMAAVKDNKYKKDIDLDGETADDFQASGTPHFFINGRRLVGAQPFEKFKPIIDEEIGKAQALIAKGTPAANVYAELTKDGKGPPEPEKKTVAAPPKDAPAKGAANAKVVIQQFSDYQCPFCSRVEPTINELMKNYGDKIKVVWRDKPLPMHPDAPLASEAAREALKQKGPDGFWKYHETLFAHQKELKRENLEKYAEEQGLDMTKFKAALDSHTHKAAVDADSKVADEAGISGTPAFVINGYFINGAQPYPKFKKLVERALAEANK